MKLSAYPVLSFFLIILAACSGDSNPVDNRAPAQLSGTIVDFFQSPMSAVKITTEPATETIYTDQTGKFVIKNISAGNYKVIAEKDGFRSESVTASIKEKQETTVSFILRLLVSVSGKIIDEATGKGIENVSITIERYPGQVTTSAEGFFQLTNIAIGSSSASFLKPGYCVQKENIFIDLNKQSGYEYRIYKLTPLDMIDVQGGTFQMGDPFGDGQNNERPVHQITVSDFSISKFEITQKAWIQIMGNNPAKFWGEENPVESVSWNDAINYCNTRSMLEGLEQSYKTVNGVVVCDFNANGYRLPTEAEWEFAARGGNMSNHTKYSGGSDLKEVGWFYTYSENITHKAGLKIPNELGIYDMSGNVWEFCYDYYDANYYSLSPEKDPAGPAQGQTRIARGGSWTDDSFFNRVFYRNYYSQNARGTNVGFRVVRGKK